MDIPKKNIRQRQMEGIKAAKLRGVKFGRPAKPLPEDFDQIYKRWMKKEITSDEAAKLCDLTRATFYRKVQKIRER